MNKNFSTAIIVFTRTEYEELQAKDFFGKDHNKSAAFVRLLNSKMASEAKETGFSVFNTSHLRENRFVDKYQRAFQEIFDQGYDRVICVGNDIPEINAALLLEVNEKLNQHDLVTATTINAGIAFLALTRAGFEHFNFHAIQWQKEQMLTSLYDYLRFQKIKHTYLKKCFVELNSYLDVDAFYKLLNDLELQTFYRSAFLEILGKKTFPVSSSLIDTTDLEKVKNEFGRPPPRISIS